jgi:hypothetical protein
MSLSPVLDHVAINVRERLDEAVETFSRLGFSLTPRGYHSMGSANHLVMFATDYLELLGLPPNPPVVRRDLMEWQCGINGLVFATENIDHVERELARKEVRVQSPRAFSRPVILPDGTVEDAKFRTLTLDRVVADYGRIYFCQHYSRHLVWRDELREHPNGAVGIVSVVISAQDPVAVASAYHKMFGNDAISRTDEGFRLTAGLGNVEIMNTASATARFGTSTEGEAATYMKALVLRSRSLEKARAIVGELTLGAGNRLIVGGTRLFNAAIEFVA